MNEVKMKDKETSEERKREEKGKNKKKQEIVGKCRKNVGIEKKINR